MDASSAIVARPISKTWRVEVCDFDCDRLLFISGLARCEIRPIP
jgi:hypothetical protein